MGASISKYWKAFRLNEVILMSGFFIIGSFFSIENLNQENIISLILLSILSFSIVFSVYSFNAAAGKKEDQNNLRLKNLWNLNKNTFYILSFVFFVLSIAICLYLNPLCIGFTIIILLLWVLYSHPRIGLKRKAIWGTLIHFIGQILHFNLAFIVFQPISLDSILIATFFSFAFSSGHLLHEIIDYESDKEAGLKTSAVLFGKKTMTFTIIVSLMINLIIILFLGRQEIIEHIAFLSFSISTFLHLILLIILYFSEKIRPTTVRNIYRVLYFFSGLVYFAYILF